MIETVSAKLESMGTVKSNIHFELFNTQYLLKMLGLHLKKELLQRPL